VHRPVRNSFRMVSQRVTATTTELQGFASKDLQKETRRAAGLRDGAGERAHNLDPLARLRSDRSAALGAPASELEYRMEVAPWGVDDADGALSHH
jgi:hypothetical protein